MMIHLSQNGENLEEFDELQIPLMISDKRIDQKAYCWSEGMEDWKSIAELEMASTTAPTEKSETVEVTSNNIVSKNVTLGDFKKTIDQ